MTTKVKSVCRVCTAILLALLKILRTIRSLISPKTRIIRTKTMVNRGDHIYDSRFRVSELGKP